MRILFLGDIVGRAGRRAVGRLLPEYRRERAIDLVIANGENLAGGIGATERTAREIFAAGVDVLTGGNHSLAQPTSHAYFDRERRLLRPENYQEEAPGRGFGIFPVAGGEVAVASLLGRIFIKDAEKLESPFRAVGRLLAGAGTRPLVIDLHAEATSEKSAFARYVDGRAAAVIGTHTHVPTADEQILPGGTAFITDAGMCGPEESVIGNEIEGVLTRFVEERFVRFEVAEGRCRLRGVELEFGPGRQFPSRIERVDILEPEL